MAYDINKLTKLAALKALAQKTKAADDALAARIKAVEDIGPQANVLEGVKVNGTALDIANKVVDILIQTGTTNGTFKANGVEVAIAGLAALAFKAEISESDFSEALATAWGNKADKANSLSGYGILDAYTKTQVDGIISSVYKPAGSVAFADLPALAAGVLGNVYNVTNAFTTTADFVEGANHKHPAGTNVVVVNTGTAEEPVYKYDVLAGFVDLSDYQKTTDADEKYVAKNGTDRLMTAAEGQKLSQIADEATKVEVPAAPDNTILVNGTAKTVVAIAADAEVNEVLEEIFNPPANND